MSDIETDLQKIKEKAANPNTSLMEIASLQVKFGKIACALIEDKDKKEERKLSREVSKVIFNAVLNYIDKWIKGETEPSKEEARFLLESLGGHEEMEVNWAVYEKALNGNKVFDEDEKQEIIRQIKKEIEEFKKRRPDLIKLFQKWQEKHQKHRHEKEDEDLDSEEISTESQQKKIELLEKQLAELKKGLEKSKKEQDSSTDDAHKQQFQSWIETLQKKEKEIQNQLDKLKKENSSTSDNSSDTNKGSGRGKPLSPWVIILIVLGVLVAAGAAAYFILERKEKPKPKLNPKKKPKSSENG